jgi:hypothetical protein
VRGQITVGDKPTERKGEIMSDERWATYRLRLDFMTSLCASVPANPELIAKWLAARQPRVRPPGGKSIDEINEEVFATLPELEEPEPALLIFQRNPTNGSNLVIRAATLRAHMKDCAGVISRSEGKIEGESSFAVKVKNYLYHDPKDYWLPVLRPDGSIILDADGRREKPIHVRDARGRPMNALKCFEFVNPARIDVILQIWRVPTKDGFRTMITEKDLQTLFLYGGCHGYGGERSDGEGRYNFTLTEVTEEKEELKHVKPTRESRTHA